MALASSLITEMRSMACAISVLAAFSSRTEPAISATPTDACSTLSRAAPDRGLDHSGQGDALGQAAQAVQDAARYFHRTLVAIVGQGIDLLRRRRRALGQLPYFVRYNGKASWTCSRPGTQPNRKTCHVK